MYSRKIIYLFFFTLTSVNCLLSQEYEFRFYIGANYYQGDLSPSNGKFSFSPGRLSLATMLGTKIHDALRLNLKLMVGQIGGDDTDAALNNRKIRNLSFDSPIYEAGLNAEISLNYFLKKLDKYGIDIYYTTGFNVFRFSPQTTLQGPDGRFELIDLQPLGTEGQGLPGYDDKYSLTQFNIPFGVGFKFQLFDNVELGFEFVPRVTFTDYLDDVSGAYVSYNELIAADRPLAARLANRTGEFLGTGPVMVETGTPRGDPEGNDWYFFASVYFSYNFGSGFVAKKLIKGDELDTTEGVN
ncbi:MAG: DUF6089 family protein [Bacteroidota bacterium]